MKIHRIRYIASTINTSPILLAALTALLSLVTPSSAVELPPESPLWENGPPEHPIRLDAEEKVRSHPTLPGSPTGQNRAFSSASSPTYSIHRSEEPNGVGLVICPSGGFRDIWIDREGHDLAIWLKDHGVTSLVLKYRTRPIEMTSKQMWQDYQNAVQADGRRAIRILREQANELSLDPHNIGISGFSAGGHLAISCTWYVRTHSALFAFGIDAPGNAAASERLLLSVSAFSRNNSAICGRVRLILARSSSMPIRSPMER